jgi:hypothetical protein
MTMTANFETIICYVPGLIGKVSDLHARYYSTHWNFGHFFEAKINEQRFDLELK